MTYTRRILFIMMSLASGSTFAYIPKEGNVNGTFGTYIYRTHYPETSSGIRSPYLGGLGFVLNGDSNDRGSLEIGLFHMNKIFSREDSGNRLVESIKSIQVNMGYRWWLNPYLSTSLTFFSSYPMGDPQTVHREVEPDFFMDTSARDLTEYGFDFAVQYQVFTYQEDYAIVLDGRYSWLVTPKSNEYGDQYGVLVGIRFLIQDKGDPPPSKK